ncbi:polysaccharide deacetylase family protein [Candidatus Latescibacterota bacterium]
MLLMYHNIDDSSGFNTVSTGDFQNHMRYITDTYDVVSFTSYISGIKAHDTSRGSVAVTFDDAYVSFRDTVLPVCEELSLPVIVFVPVDHVGGHNVWDKGKSDRTIDILSWDDLMDIAHHELVTIGSHGLSHSSLGKLPVDRQEEEVRLSRDELQNRLGVDIQFFSYPYGQKIDYSDATVDLLKKYEFTAACSTRFGRTNRARDLYQLERVEVEPHDTLDSFRKKCTKRMHPAVIKRYIKECLYFCRLYK